MLSALDMVYYHQVQKLLCWHLSYSIPDKDDHKLILNSQRTPNKAKECHFTNQLIEKFQRPSDFGASGRGSSGPALGTALFIISNLFFLRYFCVCKLHLFVHFQLMIKSICALLDKQKVGYVLIDGATSASNREKYCHEFQTQVRFQSF